MLLLLPYSLPGLANFLYRRHDATVRSTRRTAENPATGEVRKRPSGRSSEKTPSRDCLKSLGRACCMALQAAQKVLSVHVTLRKPAEFTLEALLKSLFGQFL